RRELARGLHDDAHQLVAATVPVQIRNAEATQTNEVSRLRAGRDLHPALAVERRHVDLGAERSLGEAHRHLAHHVGALTEEERVLRHLDQHVEIAGLTAGAAALALAPELQSRAAVHAGGNPDAQRVLAPAGARAAAVGARVGDHDPASVAAPPRPGAREEAPPETQPP